jgi:uncharacterized protein (UPF0305 family)
MNLKKELRMAYKDILKKFMILLKTIPNEVDFYDIWEIRAVIKKIEKNLTQLTKEEKKEFLKLITYLVDKLNNVKALDELAKKEIKILFDLAEKENDILKIA